MTDYIETYTYAGAIQCLTDRMTAGAFNGAPAAKASLEIVTGRGSFYTTKTPQDCIDVMRNGWKKGRDGLKAAIANMPTIEVDGPIADYDVAGGLPDVPTYLSGDPEHFITWGNSVEKRQPVVTLYVNRAAHCGIDSKSLANYGAAIIRYAMGLEAAGITAEVIIYSAVISGGDTVTSLIKVKDADAPWDIDRIAFAFAHGDMLRRVIFAMNESDTALREAKPNFFHGYGSPAELPEKLKAMAPTGSVFFSRLRNDISAEEAIAMVDGIAGKAIEAAWMEAAA